MASSGYTAWSVVAGETPTTTKWNLLGSNDASFNTGLGLNDGAIITRHIAAGTQIVQVTKNPYKFSVYMAAAYTPSTANNWNIIRYDTLNYDTGLNYSTTSYRFTATLNGFYHFDAQYANGGTDCGVMILALYKNGNEHSRGDRSAGSNVSRYLGVSRDIQLVAGDYVDVRIYEGTVTPAEVSYQMNWFNGHLISAT